MLLVFLVAVFSATWVGISGLRVQRSAVTQLYTTDVIHSERAATLATSLGDEHAATLQLLLAPSRPAAMRVNAELNRISNEIAVAIETLQEESSDNRSVHASMQAIGVDWAYLQGLITKVELAGPTSAARAIEINEVENIFTPMTAAANSIVQVEATQAKTSYHKVIANYNSSVHLMMLVLVLVLLIAGGILAWLVRSVLSRILAYSAFAKKVTDGDFTEQLSVRGRDELDELGTTLDVLARRWQAEEVYEKAKFEFASAMQLTEDEQEARGLLKHHLELAIPECTITILIRNNSADRLEAVTEVPVGSPLAESLEGAKPRSCLAMRMAQTHVGATGQDELLTCTVCSNCKGQTTCIPLLVSGEVIGTVLVNHSHDLEGNDLRSINEAVLFSAPILGNLRNLAVAETRAATDGLTGLPNRRALEDSLKRMVAQSTRSNEPLAALMCDLDHFKLVNDVFGHGKGDEVLAAVGVAFAHTMRASDFVGRYGGEEFLILLPSTDTEGAVQMAARVRAAVADIKIPLIDHQITMSVGIAVLPDHAIDSESLAQASDRALYAAKNGGRDRAVVFSSTAAVSP